VHLPEPPKALKLRYAFLTLYSFKEELAGRVWVSLLKTGGQSERGEFSE
jgi:hypothetical protein